MRAGFIASEVGIGLRRNLTMTFAVIITVAISLSQIFDAAEMADALLAEDPLQVP